MNKDCFSWLVALAVNCAFILDCSHPLIEAGFTLFIALTATKAINAYDDKPKGLDR